MCVTPSYHILKRRNVCFGVCLLKDRVRDPRGGEGGKRQGTNSKENMFSKANRAELPETMTTHPRPAQVQMRQNPSSEGGVGTQPHPKLRSYLQLVPAG